MPIRHHIAWLALLAIIAILLAGTPALPVAQATVSSATTARYIVTLDSPPLAAGASLTALGAADANQSHALTAVSAIIGGPVTPLYTYRYALNGFAVALTAKQAAAVAALPGVARVSPERISTLQTDRGPTFIGAVQANQQPALFLADLAGTHGAAGHVVASYDAATKQLKIQLLYHGLGGTPTLAELRLGLSSQAGTLVTSLASVAIGTPDATGAYAGVVTLDAAADTALFAKKLFFALDGPADNLRGQLTPSQGEGVVVGVIDTGINVSHPAFSDQPADGYVYTNPLGDGNYLGVCSNKDSDGRFDATFTCNKKLIGAYTFANTADIPDPQGLPSPRDDHGHGSHTSSTIAGNVLSSAVAPGGPIGGVAPHANLIMYDACGTVSSPGSCSSLALVAAIDQAIANQVDVISYSIGGTSSDPWSDEMAQGFLSALEAGIFVSVAAGNEGPTAGTIGSPANAPWLLGVAASTHDRRFVNSLNSFNGGNANLWPTLPLTGTGVSVGLETSTALVDAASLSPDNTLCDTFTAEQAAQVAGKIVVCTDDSGAGSAAPNLWEAGAVGAIFVNSDFVGNQIFVSVFTKPTVQLTPATGATLRAWLSGCTDCTARISGVTRILGEAADTIADFSSRGPDASLPNILKPDVAAPGVDILAAGADKNPRAPDYEIMSGTSMAAPHASGLATLVHQIHPDWTPAEVKSALMLTAKNPMRKEDGMTASDPFDRGAGRINAQAAFAGFVLPETGAKFRAANPTEGGDPISLNLASLANDGCVFTCTFTRTLRSTLGVTTTWDVAANNGTGFTLTTVPTDAITLAPGQSATLVITATATAAAYDVYSFGSLSFTPRTNVAPAASIPVAIKTTRTSLKKPLVIPTIIQSGTMTMTMRAVAFSNLTTKVYGLVKLTAETHLLAEDPTPGDLTDVAAGGVYVKQVILPAGVTRIWAQTRNGTAQDIDLYVIADLNNDGKNELICQSFGITSNELCDLPSSDLVNGVTLPLTVFIVVQNLTGSGAAQDSVELRYGAVEQATTNNLTVSGPQSVPAGQPFDLTLAWNLPNAQAGDTYIGTMTLGSSPGIAAIGDLGGVPVTVYYQPYRMYFPALPR